MSLIDGLLIFFAIILAYFVIVLTLKKRGTLEKLNISLYGPALLLKTTKGKKTLVKISKIKRFWKAYGSFAVFFCFIMMVLMTLVLIWQAWAVFGFTPEQKEALPGPEVALVLPGINPILPLEFIGYIILALAIAIIIHEFSHGILSIIAKVKVKSLGLLYLIIPIGAFVEPDEEELKKVSAVKRMRVYAAGPLSNFVMAMITIIIFSFIFMSAVQPAADGAVIFSIDEDSPADNIGIHQGVIIYNFNDTEIKNELDLYTAINNTEANQTVTVSYAVTDKKYENLQVTLSDKYDEYEKRNYYLNNSFKNKGYFGVSSTLIKERFTDYVSMLKNPFNDIPDSLLIFYVLPLLGYFQGYNPIVEPFIQSYEITGPLSVIPTNVFWIIVNALYWIFWLNLAVGLFNVLPMIPLDGGFLFNDGISTLIKKIKKDITQENVENIVRNISTGISLLILFAIILPFIIKYL